MGHRFPGTGWGNRGNPGGTLGSAFLKDFLRGELPGTGWGNLWGKSNFSWGNLGGTLGTTFLKDFLRGELPGTGWGNRGNPGGTFGSAFLKDFLRDVGGTLLGEPVPGQRLGEPGEPWGNLCERFP